MANPEHLAILKQGVKAWNEWRKSKPYLRPDLRAAILPECELSGVNFRFTDLQRANLRNAVLVDADFSLAYLHRAVLMGANLTNASMFGTDCGAADLDGVNLSSANLDTANFNRATLRQANFDSATLYETILSDTDLSGATGLETCRHLRPSTLDFRTLVRCQGLPLSFLRGCGLPDGIIDYLRVLNTEPIQFYSCFISYSTKDQDFADRLYGDLQNRGVRCWFAPHDIQAGKKIHEQIDQAIRLYDRLLLILSDCSMNSEWVKTEIANARQKELDEKRRVLFPISLGPFGKIWEWKCFDADVGKDTARETPRVLHS